MATNPTLKDLQEATRLDGEYTPSKNATAVSGSTAYIGNATNTYTPKIAPKTSLDSIISANNALKPITDGTAKGYSDAQNYWSNYLNELNNYASNNGKNNDFDYTTYNIMKNYVEGQKNASDNAYASYLATQKDANTSKLEQASAMEQAQKYAMNALNAQGLGTQGVAQSTMAGIGNTYAQNIGNINTAQQNANSQIMSDYNNAISSAENTKLEAEINNAQQSNADNYATALSMLQEAQSIDDINKVKDIYYDSMNDNQKKVFDYYASSINQGYGIADENIANVVNSGAPSVVGKEITPDLINQEFTIYGYNNEITNRPIAESEATNLKNYSNTLTKADNGKVIKVTSYTTGANTSSIYAMYYNGSLYQINPEQYDISNNKVEIYGSKIYEGGRKYEANKKEYEQPKKDSNQGTNATINGTPIAPLNWSGN